MAYGNPALFGRLMDTLVKSTTDYLSAQITAGAEAVMLFDTWAGMLSPSQFLRHVVEPTTAIVEELNRRHPGVPVIGFPRLAGQYAGLYAERTGVDCVALWRCRATWTRSRCWRAARPFGQKLHPSWMRFAAGHISLTWVTASCRRQTRIMWRSWSDICAVADQPDGGIGDG
jgi:hypothetical protein